jgi:hypothetical protein
MLLWMLGCASLVGIEELPALPTDFPLTLEGEIGHVTRSPVGQLAVDVAFSDEERARTAWNKLVTQAEARGFTVTHRGHLDKRDRVVLEGPDGKLEVACCRQRADRRQLVFVSWWAPDGE